MVLVGFLQLSVLKRTRNFLGSRAGIRDEKLTERLRDFKNSVPDPGNPEEMLILR